MRFNLLLICFKGPSVTFMMKQLKLEGVDVRPEHFPCVPCDLQRAGGFDHRSGSVILCQGNFFGKKHMEHTITHELVHLYDHTKFNVDWHNLRHHACSEVRGHFLGLLSVHKNPPTHFRVMHLDPRE
jgi:inner membrane protease ATP23